MHSPAKPITPVNAPPRFRSASVSGLQIAVLFGAFTLLISIPIWTHPVPPLSDYVNHLARMQVIATLAKNPQLAQFYEINWQVIPNLTMDIIVPPIARVMNIYLAGQAFIVAMFALIISGILVLNRALIGRWSVLPLFAIPLLYNWIFLIGLMNYIFGIGVALWALAGWVAARERRWPLRFVLSTLCVVVLFFCHLSALGIYGIGILSFEMFRLWTQRAEPWPRRIAEFVASGLPFLAVVPLLYASPTMNLVSDISWDQRGKLDGADVHLQRLHRHCRLRADGDHGRERHLGGPPPRSAISPMGVRAARRWRRGVFRTAAGDVRHLHGRPARADRHRLHGFACGELDVRHRLVWRGFLTVLVILTAGRVLEIDYNWSQLSDSTSEFRASVRRIVPGSKVFVAYGNASAGEDVRDLGLVHAATIATIERSSLVTTLFTVQGKQIVHVRPDYREFADLRDGTPPSTAQLILAAEHPLPNTPAFWLNWTKFDYIYILFTEDDAPNPDPTRLKLVADGDRFQLYRIIKRE